MGKRTSPATRNVEFGGAKPRGGPQSESISRIRAAFDYLTVARRHLGDRAWNERPELTFTLHRELAECAYLAGEHATAEELVETALAHAPSKVAQADLYALRVLAATVASEWARPYGGDAKASRCSGSNGRTRAWPTRTKPKRRGHEERRRTKDRRARRRAGSRRRRDPRKHAPRVDPRCAGLLLGRRGTDLPFGPGANLSLLHGPSPYSAFAYVLYGAIHNARTGQYDVGYAFGKLALALAQRFGNRAEECRTLEVYGVLVHPWKAPLRDGLPLLKEGYRAGVESGELAYAAST